MNEKKKTAKEMILAHHGVKGMKWGVRRYQNKAGQMNKRHSSAKLSKDFQVLDKKASKLTSVEDRDKFDKLMIKTLERLSNKMDGENYIRGLKDFSQLMASKFEDMANDTDSGTTRSYYKQRLKEFKSYEQECEWALAQIEGQRFAQQAALEQQHQVDIQNQINNQEAIRIAEENARRNASLSLNPTNPFMFG